MVQYVDKAPFTTSFHLLRLERAGIISVQIQDRIIKSSQKTNQTLIFSRISTIAVLIPQIPVLNGNDPFGWSVIGFTHS
jgi:hypothetical protein